MKNYKIILSVSLLVMLSSELAAACSSKSRTADKCAEAQTEDCKPRLKGATWCSGQEFQDWTCDATTTKRTSQIKANSECYPSGKKEDCCAEETKVGCYQEQKYICSQEKSGTSCESSTESNLDVKIGGTKAGSTLKVEAFTCEKKTDGGPQPAGDYVITKPTC